MEKIKLSERLKQVLQDLEHITTALETAEVETEPAANDDFLTRETTTRVE